MIGPAISNPIFVDPYQRENPQEQHSLTEIQQLLQAQKYPEALSLVQTLPLTPEERGRLLTSLFTEMVENKKMVGRVYTQQQQAGALQSLAIQLVQYNDFFSAIETVKAIPEKTIQEQTSLWLFQFVQTNEYFSFPTKVTRLSQVAEMMIMTKQCTAARALINQIPFSQEPVHLEPVKIEIARTKDSLLFMLFEQLLSLQETKAALAVKNDIRMPFFKIACIESYIRSLVEKQAFPDALLVAQEVRLYDGKTSAETNRQHSAYTFFTIVQGMAKAKKYTEADEAITKIADRCIQVEARIFVADQHVLDAIEDLLKARKYQEATEKAQEIQGESRRQKALFQIDCYLHGYHLLKPQEGL